MFSGHAPAFGLSLLLSVGMSARAGRGEILRRRPALRLPMVFDHRFVYDCAAAVASSAGLWRGMSVGITVKIASRVRGEMPGASSALATGGE